MKSAAEHVEIRQLIEDLGVGRSTIYNRLKELKIKPVNIKAIAHLTTAQAKRLENYIRTGMDDFEQSTNGHVEEVDVMPVQQDVQLSGLAGQSTDQLTLMLSMMQMLAHTIRPPELDTTRELDRRISFLSKQAKSGRELPTSALAPVLGIKRSTLSSYKAYELFGFICAKLPRKKRSPGVGGSNESQWIVKQKTPDEGGKGRREESN